MRLEVRRILLVTGPSFSSPIYKKNKTRGYLSYLVMVPKVKKIIIFTYLKKQVQNGHAALNRLMSSMHETSFRTIPLPFWTLIFISGQ